MLLDAIALEVDQVNAAAKIRAALRGQVDDVGPTDRVTSGTALLDDGELEHLAGAGPQAPTIFSVRARILDATRVRLEIELAFEGSEPMETTVVITEGRPVVLQGEAAVAGRRQALVLRAAVIRSDADLYAEFVKRSAHRGASP